MTIEELKVIIDGDTKGLQKELGKAQKQVVGLSKDVNVLGKAIKAAFGGISLYGIYKAGKACVEVASEFEEFGNTADQVFGKASKDIKDFAQNAKTQFGLSRNEALKTATTFKAMANGTGISDNTGKDMAMNLTKLTGDMASFWNVSEDIASTALSSVFTGETESLKKFGIVMTEFNLNNFAMDQGIKKTYRDMSASEQVMLRYAYVMAQTAQAQGDFARNTNSYANQMRVLKGTWQELMGQMGVVITSVLVPIISFLNKVLSLIIQVGQAFAKVFGKGTRKEGHRPVPEGVDAVTEAQPDSNGKLIEQNVGAAAGYASGIKSSMDGAAKASKKIKENLAGFDELNVISEPDTSGGNVNLPDLSGESGFVIPNLDDLYKNMNDSLDEGLEHAKMSLKDFAKWVLIFLGTGFALAVGKNVANMINNMIKQLGVAPTFSTVLGFIRQGIGKVFKDIGTFVTTGVTKISTLFKTVFSTKFLQDIANTVGSTLSTIGKQIASLGKVILSSPIFWIAAVITGIITATVHLYNTNEGFREQVDTIFGRMGEALERIKKALEPVGELLEPIGGLLGDIWEAIEPIASFILEILVDILGAVGIAILETVATTLEMLATALEWVAEKVDAIVNFDYAGFFEDIWEWISSIPDKIQKAIDDAIEFISGFVEDGLESMNEFFTNIGEGFTQWKEETAEKIEEAKQNFIDKCTEIREDFDQKVEDMKTKVGEWSENWNTKVENMKETFKTKMDQTKEKWNTNLEQMKERAGTKFEQIGERWGRMCERMKIHFQNFKNWIKVPINGIISFINGMLSGVTNAINHVIRALNSIHVSIPDWVPWVGGKSFGVHLNEVSALQVPTLATGGLAYGDTLARIGEYNGASANPEVVAPLDKLSDIMIKSFETALLSTGEENSGTYNISLELDGKQITNKVIKNIKQYEANTGHPVFNY